MAAPPAPSHADIAAAILVGGRGRRLGGRDKARLRRGDATYLERLVLQLTDRVAEVFLAGHRGQSYPEVPCRLVVDRYPGAGPLAGLDAALAQLAQPWLFLLACDMPAFDGRIVDLLAAARGDGAQIVLPHSAGRLQPTCALYHRAVLPHVRRRLDAGHYALFGLLQAVPHRTVALPEALRGALRNVNREGDLVD